MRIHNEYLTLQTKQKREFHNITENVKLALEKNGIRDGKLELGPWQSAVYVDLDGLRPKRVLMKVVGE